MCAWLAILSFSQRFPIRGCRCFDLDSKLIDQFVRCDAGIAAHTRRAYAGALDRLNRWLGENQRRVNDAALAEYVQHLDQIGRAVETARMAVKAVRFYARTRSHRCPDGALTRGALKCYRRGARERGRGQAAPLFAKDAAAILSTASERREYSDGRFESVTRAARRAGLDGALVALLFQGALRRSEAADLQWGDVAIGTDGQGVRVHVRYSKTDQEGVNSDVRYLNGEFADAVRRLRDESGGVNDPEQPVFCGLNGASLSRRLSAAAKAAGIDRRITAHSGRVGLAAELTMRGASTHDVMLAGNWKSTVMVAHYSAAARAEKGAVARYMASERVTSNSSGDHSLIKDSGVPFISLAPPLTLASPGHPSLAHAWFSPIVHNCSPYCSVPPHRLSS